MIPLIDTQNVSLSITIHILINFDFFSDWLSFKLMSLVVGVHWFPLRLGNNVIVLKS
jgi:hypothetical protein